MERLDVRHAKSLWENIQHDDHLWTYMPSEAPTSEEACVAYVEKFSKIEDPCFYAIVLRESPNEDEAVVGHIALMNMVPSNRVNELGHVLLSKKIQRTTAATEAFYLIIKASFEQLNSRRCEWKTNTFNAASRKAALRLGFTYEGIFRNHMIVKGRNRDTIWFSIIESEWEEKKRILEAWLDPSNFDEQKKQRRSLVDIAAA